MAFMQPVSLFLLLLLDDDKPSPAQPSSIMFDFLTFVLHVKLGCFLFALVLRC